MEEKKQTAAQGVSLIIIVLFHQTTGRITIYIIYSAAATALHPQKMRVRCRYILLLYTSHIPVYMI